MSKITRRSLLATTASGAAAVALSGVTTARADESSASSALKGPLKQSVCQWCYPKLSLDELCQISVAAGLKAIDLLGPETFPTLKKYGLICAMTNSHPINPGLNRIKNHDVCLSKMRTAIEATAAEGWPNVICFSGNRAGMSDEEGLKNCAEGLKKIVGFAEEKKVTLCMELLNSKRNHKDYMCDRTSWGVELCKMVGSERFKLLYDIYHMQIDEGDVIATIKENHQYLAHYHTGGVPGRNEIDETQELYYPAIAKAILATGFDGYFAHEFIPKHDPAKSLAAAARLCDVQIS